MKQQEIFKKIGGIIKELNEQYEYLESQSGDFSDLDLELFAASAHFLTDHTEILRKLNQHAGGSKPAFAEPVVPQPSPQPEPVPTMHHHHPELPVDEDIAESFAAPLPSIAESDVVFDTVPEVAAEPLVIAEPEPVFEEPNAPTAFTYQEPAAPIEETPEPEVNIEPARQDFYSYMRDEAQAAEPHHDFSISSHADEPAQTYTVPVQPESLQQSYHQTEPDLTQPAYHPAEPEQPVYREPESTPQPEPYKPEPVFEHPASSANLFNPPPVHEPKAEEPILTLNQRLSAQLQGSANTASTFQGQAVSDLKSAISMNDKLLFVKDLFNGYSLAYSEVIDILNRQKSFEEADHFLKTTYTTKYNWAEKPATVEKFYSILHRRFPQ